LSWIILIYFQIADDHDLEPELICHVELESQLHELPHLPVPVTVRETDIAVDNADAVGLGENSKECPSVQEPVRRFAILFNCLNVLQFYFLFQEGRGSYL